MSETKSEYHPVIENIFETEGEDKGRVKDVEYAQVLAQTTDKIYEKYGAAESPHKKELLDKQIDKNLRRSLAHAAVKAAHPTFDASNLNHWTAAAGIEKSPLPVQDIQEVEKLQAMAQTGNEVIGQYDSLKEK